MTRLRSEQILKDNDTQDSSSISTLKLNHKALSDVACLSDFRNLEKLDLTFNNLTSLEGLKFCTSLKWLSVVQNKLENLKGVEGLSKLTVLNAGKNKLRSMDEVRSLVNLCALILNDNEIASICKLDQMKNLNTLVLSRNQIHNIGDSLIKAKSIKKAGVKLSLSHCKLQSIGSSIKSCSELKELRLAHNDIKTLPPHLVHNKKLRNLDLGNNVISRWSDIKVLDTLVNLKNLNLQGNPVAENVKFAKKIQKVLPNLEIFNARPIHKYTKSEKIDKVDNLDDDSIRELEIQKKDKRDGIREKDFKNHVTNEDQLDYANDAKQRKQKIPKDVSEKEAMGQRENDIKFEKRPKKKLKKAEQSQLGDIDDTEASFAELFAGDDGSESMKYNHEKVVEKGVKEMNSGSKLGNLPAKRKKTKNKSKGHEIESLSVVEVGMGGPSTWGDD